VIQHGSDNRVCECNTYAMKTTGSQLSLLCDKELEVKKND